MLGWPHLHFLEQVGDRVEGNHNHAHIGMLLLEGLQAVKVPRLHFFDGFYLNADLCVAQNGIYLIVGIGMIRIFGIQLRILPKFSEYYSEFY